MADLIPDEAMLAAANAIDDGLMAALRAAAPHILAAELEHWSEHCETEAAKYAHLRSDGGRKFAAADALRVLAQQHLRPRAAELRSTTEGDARG